jgi:cobyrinic acid a,c-diamide synthase
VSAEHRASDTSPLSAIVVAGTHSGVGKTSITLGLIGALRRRGLRVQPFKVGPDFIDPLHHSHASGRPPRNLDGWMLDPETNRQRFARATADADVAVIEGVMGLFDGSEGKSDRGSTAEMAKLLDLPVLLVVDASAMARSVAALIHGYASFEPRLRVAGVILNNVGGDAHTEMIRDAVAGRIPIIGSLTRQDSLIVPERHLGLHLPHEARADYVSQLADLIEHHVDLGALLASSRTERLLAPAEAEPQSLRVRVAIARDEAFCFYYTDNLELLEQAGAELVPFSPISDPLPDNIDGIYLGGGYPELHAQQLGDNHATREAIRQFAVEGGPIYAECGGLMYLAQTLELDDRGHPMCGVLAFSTKMPADLTISYVEITTTGGILGSGQTARGHLFHHSAITAQPNGDHSYRLTTNHGETFEEGYTVSGVLASYAHLHFASNPDLAKALIERCSAFHAKRGNASYPTAAIATKSSASRSGAT